jgi:hypothetical protein
MIYFLVAAAVVIALAMTAAVLACAGGASSAYRLGLPAAVAGVVKLTHCRWGLSLHFVK